MGEFLEIADRDVDAAAAFIRQWPEKLARGHGGESLLHALAIEGCVEAVDALIRAGADLRDPIDWSSTAVSDVAQLGHSDVLAILLRSGCDPNTKDKTSEDSALSAAVRWGHLECVQLLLGAGAHVEKGNDLDGPPLITSALCDRIEIARLLLDAGANPHSTDVYRGNTALHHAAKRGNAALASLLLARGASPLATNKAGDTPIDVASAAGHVDVVALLRRATDGVG